MLDLDRGDVRPPRSRPRTCARPRRGRHPDGGVWLVGRSPPSRRGRRDERSAISSTRVASRAQVALEVVTDHARRSSGRDDERDRGRRHGSTKPSTSSTPRSSREAAERTVDALADANDTPLIEAEDDAAEDHPAVIEAVAIEAVDVEAEDVVEAWATPGRRAARGSDPRPRRRRTTRARGPERGRAVGSRREPCPPRRGKIVQRSRPPTTPCSMPTSAAGSASEVPPRASRLDEARVSRASRPRSARARLVQRLPVALVDGRDRPERGARLEIARTELDGSRTSADGGPVSPGSRSRRPCPREPAVATSLRGGLHVVHRQPLKASPPAELGEGAARLAAATRARGRRYRRREHHVDADLQRGRRLTLGRRRGQASRAVGSPRRSRADARSGTVPLGAALAEAAQRERPPERPGWSIGR